ncbi:hypothetical protein MIND_01332600 [Mycena indigotica]|uniref:Cytochrome P450 n=1 Tax=Mycena indigotica TaxID=2126181 RepID=A0A8H6VQC8_9AGAR|nr:uncharacterized protein MIND_01332400 [Mycena indigotica]XP_037213770.1 uncharacterized protein MIND_01332600 [Mycena indigotica]KAF7290190.1 hypothetical protein MIND_01332400 [Mycena indigotica]KAF7290192.1 hypothetical protein MIND_01332600 [Mycena indigotica]
MWYWEYVACGTRLVKEIGGLPENVVSFTEGVEEIVQSRITMGHEVIDNPYHLAVVRTTLTRNLHARFPDVRDEIVCGFDEIVGLRTEWKSVYVLPTIMDIVARVSNRLFVGLPLCLNKAYLDNNVQYTIDVMASSKNIGLLPPFLRPMLGPLITKRNKSFDTAMRLLGPVVAERMRQEDEYGPDWSGKPNDLISWILEIAHGDNRTVEGIVMRILAVNMAAIHTTSMAFTHMLYSLASFEPAKYLLPMRAEVEAVIADEGWSKAALGNMHLIDSFLRESQRMHGNGPVGMTRRVVARDGVTLSDGTYLPHGAFICVAAMPAHVDDANYENAKEFDGFRFARERDAQIAKEEAEPSVEKHALGRQMITTAPDHLPFGTGKHACPGRFFAATELKAMLAHLVLNYDVKAVVDGVRPPDEVYGIRINPNTRGQVLLRKRVE